MNMCMLPSTYFNFEEDCSNKSRQFISEVIADMITINFILISSFSWRVTGGQDNDRKKGKGTSKS